MTHEVELPSEGFIRLSAVTRIFPVSKSSWWRGVKRGVYPRPYKIGPGTTCWDVKDIRELIERAKTSGIQ